MNIASTLIREAIMQKGLSQKQAAAKLCISQSYLSDIVLGRRSVSAYVAVRLELLFGIDAMRLMALQTRDELTQAWKEYQAGQ